MAKQFGSSAAFKASLETHLRKRAAERGVPYATLQLKFVIERLLARLFREADPGWLLKGGFALDLRFRPRAPTTKDVDLTMSARNMAGVRDRLQRAVDADLGDFLVYRIASQKKELTNAPGGGGRLPCEALLVGKTYAKFHIDIGLGDAVIGVLDLLAGDDLLDFASIGPARVQAIPKSQQFAEKVHAYTFPWGDRLNTRTKDLVDLVLLIERGELEVEAVRWALVATYERRGTHDRPVALSPPPSEWETEFGSMAAEAGLTTEDYHAAFETLSRYWSSHRLGGNGDRSTD